MSTPILQPCWWGLRRINLGSKIWGLLTSPNLVNMMATILDYELRIQVEFFYFIRRFMNAGLLDR